MFLIFLISVTRFLSFFLVGNDVAAAQATELNNLLQCSHMQSLKELYLDDNEIESEGAVFLAEGVKVIIS